MGLIDKDALESLFAGPFVQSYEDCREALHDAPIVEAVPLDPLCTLLSQIAGAPCRSIEGDNKCTVIAGKCDPSLKNEECWKKLIKAYMERNGKGCG